MSLRPGLRVAVIGLTALAAHAAPPGTPTTQPSSVPASGSAPATSQPALLTYHAATALLEAGDGLVALCERRLGEQAIALSAGWDGLGALAVVPPGGRLLVPWPHRKFSEVDLARGVVSREFGEHQRGICALAVTAEGRHAFSSSLDTTVRKWSLSDGGAAAVVTGVPEGPTRLVVRPDGREIITGGQHGAVVLWDVATGKERRRFDGHEHDVYCLALSPDGALLFTGGQDGTARLWEVASGRELRRLDGSKGQVTGAAFSPDGATLLTAGDNWANVVLWDVASGQPRRQLAAGVRFARAVGFSPDGRLAAAGGSDQHIRLWEAATGRLVGEVQTPVAVNALAFSPDGSQLYVRAGPDLVVIPVARTLAEAPARLDPAAPSRTGEVGRLDLAPVRWQVLPREVVGVVVGPDDRVWRQISGLPERELDVAAVRAAITAQFRAPSPRIRDAFPVLFEPEGRVWFVTADRKLLLGYDGQTWIERAARGTFQGLSPQAAHEGPFVANVQCGRWRFFPDGVGVQIFDGAGWTHFDLPPASDAPAHHRGVTLAPQADGESLTVYRRGDPLSLWTWRAGRWTKLDPRRHFAAWAGSGMSNVVPLAGSRLLISGAGRFGILHSPADARPAVLSLDDPGAELFREALLWLGSLDRDAREAGQNYVTANRLEFWNLMTQTITTTETPEIAMRLQRALADVPGPADAGRTGVKLGPYRIREPTVVRWEPSGVLAIGARAVSCTMDLWPASRAKPGLVLRSPGGRWTFFPGATLEDYAQSPTVLQSGPARAWCRNLVPGEALVLVDLIKGRVIDRVPDLAYQTLLAVRADGTLFVRGGEIVGPPGRIGVYQPAQALDRPPLAVVSHALYVHNMRLLASDGAAWFAGTQQGIRRLDGQAWADLPGFTPKSQAFEVWCGHDGAVLIVQSPWGRRAGPGPSSPREPQVVLTVGSDRYTAESLEELAERHPDVVRRTFAGGAMRSGHPPAFAVAAAPDRMWVGRHAYSRGGPDVLARVDGRWQSVREALAAAGVASAEVLGQVPVGGGRAVVVGLLVRTPKRLRRAVAVVAVEEGHIVIQSVLECPAAWKWDDQPVGGDAAWVQVLDADRNVVLARVGADGIQVVGPNLQAALVDAGGVAWLYRPGSPSRLTKLWHNGRLVDLAATGEDRPDVYAWQCAVSDHPGSVWAITPDGLEHFVADDPAQPETYRRVARCELSKQLDFYGEYRPRHCTYSQLGYIGVVDDRSRNTLQTVRLPGPDSQPASAPAMR